MELKKGKLVRFYSDGKKQKEPLWRATEPPTHEKSSSGYKVASSSLHKASNVFPSGKNIFAETFRSRGSKVFPEDHEPWTKIILDPGSEIVLKWNRIFIVSCLVALFIDPLYFYLPSVRGNTMSACVRTDLTLRIIVTFLRTIADIFYLLHLIIKFRTAYIAPSSRVFGRGELVMDPKKIARRYIRSDFFIDVIATLPLPQVLGASWYLLSVDRYTTCWKSICKKEPNPEKCFSYLDCSFTNNMQRRIWANTTNVFNRCDPNNDIDFKFGIFESAVKKQVVSSNFIPKYFYCLWWGLQQLSSYGQNLDTSTFIGETSFAILIAIMGLVLFSHLIGNMQTYLQSITIRLEEWRLKRRDTEEWMRHRQLPEDLRSRVRRFVQYKWLATRGVDEETILRALPADLRRDIQRHLCLDLVRRVPFFSQMDDQLLDAICERLVSSLSTLGTYIVREGDPVTEMLFIIRGRLDSSTTNGGRTGFFNSIILRPGDFCGEELLSWALLPRSTTNLPSSTRTVKALSEVEAFALRAEDLKFVANQFRRLHSKKLQHTFRFYSHHWRTWAACFIQAAWRRYKKRMSAKDLSLRESIPSDETAVSERVDDEEEYPAGSNSSQTKLNLGVTILASMFAANTRRGALKIKDDLPKLPKPEEPDFSTEADD
ncbi:cyclic nucleotide-gated ion channel 17 isoform X2 [Arachis ipaensis]|uniref:cyclic nucleotide-gated ion channel 17 isoform X2 n=1 Tax=Arachis ipaensis TaxID=130454 RepID=UPI000A2B68B2|nr:cyclic nucleotide-gated ion channel 17 isoform X2 [Arachis ipaensis]XP_025643834.1 cyclic nucleotide-gated ion channel 17 isoform X2 [Arachis hypogaea]